MHSPGGVCCLGWLYLFVQHQSSIYCLFTHPLQTDFCQAPVFVPSTHI